MSSETSRYASEDEEDEFIGNKKTSGGGSCAVERVFDPSVKGVSERYEKISFLGEGQFATVFKARDKATNDIVAIKKIKVGKAADAKDGMNRTALREIKLLQELHHPNIIGLLDVFGKRKANVNLVFEFMDTDLEILIKEKSIIFKAADIKRIILMTLQGIEYLHDNWVLHRDLKPNNLLVGVDGTVKITDFGLARTFGSPDRLYSSQVVTRWYRSPELLLGAKNYGTGVDIWAVGCIFAELMLRNPFLPGESDLDQLNKIFSALGTPTFAQWPGMKKLPDYVQFQEYPAVPFSQIFTAASHDAIRLIGTMFEFDPCNRCTASEALKSDYFRNKPYAAPPQHLPKLRKVEPNKKRGPVDKVAEIAAKRAKIGVGQKLVF
eukprot:Nk52_evm1s232 gene=Nk52_evmTU1s232